MICYVEASLLEGLAVTGQVIHDCASSWMRSVARDHTGVAAPFSKVEIKCSWTINYVFLYSILLAMGQSTLS
jgi:hypothetical protein